jgi:antirestriction protein
VVSARYGASPSTCRTLSLYFVMADKESLRTATLYAIHKHIAVKCKECNAAWLKCKQDHADPKDCLQTGKEVIQCVNDLCAPLFPLCRAH